MITLRRTLALSLAAALVSLAFASPRAGAQQAQPGPQRVDLVLYNGKIFAADGRGTLAQAVAVRGSRIALVGSDGEIRTSFRGDREIDLHGQLVTPGFNDSHLHFLNGGLSLARVNFAGAKTLEETKRRIAARAREVPAGAWVLGRGWDHTLWGGEWPTRKDLDEVAPRNPVFVQRVDGHVSWANSLALEKAGVTRATRAPEGGEILRDAAGEPTGSLKETAAGLVGRVVPAPSREEKMEALRRSLAEARRHGITSVQDSVSGYETLALYRELLAKNQLTVRVAEWLSMDTPVEELKRQRAEFDALHIDPLRIRISAVKGYVDGTLGSRTAAMLAPFSDDPHNSGIPRMTQEELTRRVVALDAAGFQVTLHAIGDRANRMALDAFEAGLKANGKKIEESNLHTGQTYMAERRHRVEHAQVVAPSDFARYRDLGVVASMQPSHAISDKRWAPDRLGEYRSLGAYSWHTFEAYGVHVPFGTDWPIEPISPYLGLFAAVTRESTEFEPRGGWLPQERLDISEAIRCYTAESAYASFEEKEKGRIAPGMLADLVVHTRDLLTVKPEEILQTEAALTIFDGRIVYERGQ
ncbi:MAG TPA: amidohydrolase [Pyrinomonadaceae bacterium]|jgi:predicted amidohydrolase YtcJ|nr:amidohydrolase [Pyrinomonadaceae bacterium]